MNSTPPDSAAPARFRQYLFPHDHPRLADVRGLDAYAYRDVAASGGFTGGLVEGWRPLYRQPFVGITTDGTVVPDLYPLTPAPDDEAAPVAAMVAAANRLLQRLSDEERQRISHPVDAVEWQTWANPEFMQFDTGLRLENVSAEVVDATFDLVRASTSPAGYEAVRLMMQINGYLGEVVDLPTILGELSYNVALYGTPAVDRPWGWQLFGHHCAVNCLVVDGRMVMTPLFLGAEPDLIDAGPLAHGPAFTRRIDLGRELMAALTPEQRQRAVVYEQMVDPAMPEGRVHPGDERHLGGAFQDNRLIPYEGVCVGELSETARELVWSIVDEFVGVMPDGPARARRREVEAHAAETWFSWIGGYGPDDVFYYRVQSPVILAELDHHCGVFLDYDTPQDFHIHTVLRTPNGGDYGRALVRQWQERHGETDGDRS